MGHSSSMGEGSAAARIDLVILGSTGSIGTQALNVVREHPGRFRVVGLAAGGSNLDLLKKQIGEFSPSRVAIGSEETNAADLAREFPRVDVARGPKAVEDLAGGNPAATVLNGITGGIGLGATLAALQSGSTLALANKESLVVGGSLVRSAMVRPGQVVPVDSEHSAIAQALLSGVHNRGMVSPNVDGKSELAEIVLTASGGPFRGLNRSQLKDVTVDEALDHPTWDMGPVVTINSSTLMNKGLELIEAAILFDVNPTSITPVVHPQSIVHSMVTWQDGSTIAQASPPNMELPIALGIDWPAHMRNVGVPLSWTSPQAWQFEPVDDGTFPALKLSAEALAASASHPAVLNAANEVAVDAFLRGGLPWLSIVDTVDFVLQKHEGVQDPTRGTIDEIQRWAESEARARIAKVSQ